MILAVLVLIAAAVLILWPRGASEKDPVQQTPTGTEQPFAELDEPSGEHDAVPVGQGALAQHLGSEDSEIAGLTKEQMVSVDDLAINPDLPKEWKNVLLLGTDQRNLNESSRSDTMIICSINTATGKVKLTSLMRDIAVEFDSLGKNNNTYRLNAANFFGGPKLTIKTINELLDMNIDSYVMVNFYGFTQMAEALGGIEMTITEDEMKQINKNAKHQAGMAYYRGIDETNLLHTNVLLEEWGDVHLNGRQVLAYARIRKIDSDFGRAERQRKVLSAMLEKMRGKNILELATLAANLQKHFETNMSLDEIVTIANIVLNSDLSSVEQMRIPQDRTYVQEKRNGQSMFYDVDWATNSYQLHNFIYYK
ncbi:MAG: hypothetical protein GX592_09015 [Clostridiales bacterium]|nr:hypothetical protein [Clostridiales bacterium]